ncbi:MAG: ATP-grasp domain-containing protein [Eubacteriales bacterium]|nr:ATP-grasp domain-containing protein [Eubacteriales bacterium]
MKKIWLLYERQDLQVNLDYAAMMNDQGKARGLAIEPVTLDQLTLTMNGQGEPHVLRNGEPVRPDAVLSRMRQVLYSRHFEAMDVPVFNGSRVCELCNDKRRTHQFLSGLPMPFSSFVTAETEPPAAYPVIVKPACSHGGDRVQAVSNPEQWRLAVRSILPEPTLQQRVVGMPGFDLRVYVLFEQIVGGVLRTAKTGVVSNFKRGGDVRLHPLTQKERELAQRVIRRFHDADAPLCMAGIDLLYEAPDCPVVGEVEDVVGSRMLYQTSDIDIVSLYLDGVKMRL